MSYRVETYTSSTIEVNTGNEVAREDRTDGGAGFYSDRVNITLADGRSIHVTIITDEYGKTHASAYVHEADSSIAAAVTLFPNSINVRDLREGV